jgi:hypothetical protein
VLFSSFIKTSVQNLIKQPQKGSKLGTIQQISDFRTEPNAVKAMSVSPTLSKLSLQLLCRIISITIEDICTPTYGLQFLYRNHSSKPYGLCTRKLQILSQSLKFRLKHYSKSENSEFSPHHFEPPLLLVAYGFRGKLLLKFILQ